jgi:hypothetical protein
MITASPNSIQYIEGAMEEIWKEITVLTIKFEVSFGKLYKNLCSYEHVAHSCPRFLEEVYENGSRV